jgi:CheY-like chemotaxis protein
LANPSFGEDIAEKVGLSYRTIARAVALAEALCPDVVAKVRHTPLASNQAALETLAKHPAERQIAAVDLILQTENPAKSVNEAFARIDGHVVKPAAELKVSKFIDQWARLSAKEKREALDFLASADLPKGYRIEVAK